MLGTVARRGAEIGVCGTCMEARGITETDLAEGTGAVPWHSLPSGHSPDKVLVF